MLSIQCILSLVMLIMTSGPSVTLISVDDSVLSFPTQKGLISPISAV